MSEAIKWVWDPSIRAYFHSASNTYAVVTNGEWVYIAAEDSAPPHSPSHSHEIEEGEVQESVGWGALMEDGDEKEKEVVNNGIEVLRLVILESDVESTGKLAVIDADEDGVQIGRDKSVGHPRVRLKEMAVSKTHAVVYKRDKEWWIVDLGSTHGTTVTTAGSALRLSEPKTSSQPHRLHHQDTITIGSTVLEVHLHSEWPCEACQNKGTNLLALNSGREPSDASTPVAPEAQPSGPRGRHAMTLLKQTLLEDKERVQTDTKYIDRSAIRRQTHRHSPPRRSASPPRPAAKLSTYGSRLLQSQGWSSGQGLGAKKDGIAEPITLKTNTDKRGLGEDEDDWRIRGKRRRWREAQ